MKRNLTFEEISDGKRYTSGDLAKIGCGDCNGCFECCKVTEDTTPMTFTVCLRD